MHGLLSWRLDRRTWRAERSRVYDNHLHLLTLAKLAV